MTDREQAIKDVAEATECSVDGILECLNSPSDGTGYLLLEDSATIYAVSQRECVIQLERALRNELEYCRCGGTGLYSYNLNARQEDKIDCAECVDLRAALEGK